MYYIILKILLVLGNATGDAGINSTQRSTEIISVVRKASEGNEETLTILSVKLLIIFIPDFINTNKPCPNIVDFSLPKSNQRKTCLRC